VLIPREPSEAMLDSFIMDQSGTFEGAYKALLSAAPKP